MKINHQPGIQGINPYQKQLKKSEAVNPASKPASDKLEISSAAKEMQGAGQLLAERSEKIASLKAQVANGTYQIDAKTTARAMLAFYGKQ